MDRLVKKHVLEKKLKGFYEWAHRISVKYMPIILTDNFINAFAEDLETELKLNVDIKKLLKALAYRYIVSFSKNVIALAGLRISMLATSVVLATVNILVEEQYFFLQEIEFLKFMTP